MPAGQTLWSRLRADPSGLVGLAIVAFFLLLALGAWFGFLGQDWSAADGGRWEPAGAQWRAKPARVGLSIDAVPAADLG